MREKRTHQRMQLPGSDYEAWLHTQTVAREGGRHRTPARDLYEEWLERRIDERLGKPHVGACEKEGKGKTPAYPRVDWVQWN